MDGETVTAALVFDISGVHRPATWGYYGGDPPESPELDDVRLVLGDRELPLSLVTKAEYDRLESKAFDAHSGEDEPDDCDDYDPCDYDHRDF